jgi:hypothetical protein
MRPSLADQLRDYRGRFATLKCVNGHDRCHEGPSEECPYCERVAEKRDVAHSL